MLCLYLLFRRSIFIGASLFNAFQKGDDAASGEGRKVALLLNSARFSHHPPEDRESSSLEKTAQEQSVGHFDVAPKLGAAHRVHWAPLLELRG